MGMSSDGKAARVTDAGGGIGYATASAFAMAGARVALVDPGLVKTPTAVQVTMGYDPVIMERMVEFLPVSRSPSIETPLVS